MATLEDVRKFALALPEVVEQPDRRRGGTAWRTRRGFVVWERPPSKTDLAQLEDLGRAWPDGTVIGIHVEGLDAKDALLSEYPGMLFTIPHFDGYPAVLAELDTIEPDLLEDLIAEAWLTRVSKRVATQWLAERGQA